MTQLNYRIELHNGESYLGACRAEEGETHIILPLHGTLRGSQTTSPESVAFGAGFW